MDAGASRLHQSPGGASEAGLLPSTESAPTRPPSGPGAAAPDEPEAGPPAASGVPNPAYAEEPPPYSPPDPKTAHLLFPAFASNVPGHGPIFLPPAPLQQAPNQQPGGHAGPYPFAIYDSSLFGEAPRELSQERPPKDYLVESVLVMLFCCLLTGGIAFVYSHEARTAANQGDLTQATAASQKARSLILLSLFFGIFVSVSWVIYVLVTLNL